MTLENRENGQMIGWRRDSPHSVQENVAKVCSKPAQVFAEVIGRGSERGEGEGA